MSEAQLVTPPLLARDGSTAINVVDHPGYECLCVGRHVPRPIQIHRHHLIPLAWDGPDTPDNTLYLCPTTHANVHELLRFYVKAGGLPHWGIRQHYGSYARELAQYAWDRRPSSGNASRAAERGEGPRATLGATPTAIRSSRTL